MVNRRKINGFKILEEYDKTGILLIGKEKVSISLDKAIVKKLKDKKINLSQFINNLLKKKLTPSN